MTIIFVTIEICIVQIYMYVYAHIKKLSFLPAFGQRRASWMEALVCSAWSTPEHCQCRSGFVLWSQALLQPG